MFTRSIARFWGPLLGCGLGAVLPAIAAGAQTQPPQAAPPTSAPAPNPPAPTIRETSRTASKCYIGRSPEDLKSYDCEITSVYTSRQPYPSAVQIRWSYGGLSDFSRNADGGWRWYDPSSKRWLDTDPRWVELEAGGCFRFGNMCFGRGFPVVPEMKSSPTPSQSTAAPPATLPRGTTTPAN